MTTEIKPKKKKKRSPVMLTTILLLFLLIVILVTLAFFTSTDEATNRFEGVKIDIILSEPKWKPDKAINIVPDATLEKDPYITNNEDVPAYVFLKVTVPAVKYHYDDDGRKNSLNKGKQVTGIIDDYIPLYKFAVTDDNGTPDDDSDDVPEWDKSFTTNQKFYNHYIGCIATILTSSNETNDNVYNTSGASSYSIKVQAYGIQSKYLGNNGEEVNDPLAVWNKINS